MAFLDPDTRRPVLDRLAAHLRAGGRIVVGFGAGRDYPFAEFFDDVDQVGLVPDVLFSTWDLRPFTLRLRLPRRGAVTEGIHDLIGRGGAGHRSGMLS